MREAALNSTEGELQPGVDLGGQVGQGTRLGPAAHHFDQVQQPDVRSQDIIHARVGSGRGRGCHGTIVSHPWLAPGDLRSSLR